jgi:two-component system sensor histidine kinase ChvG
VNRLFRLASRISIRLLAFNVLLIFLPAAALRYLDVYERELLDAQERVMVQQGRVLAAALSERGVLKAAYAEGILVRLRQQSQARMRVIDAEGRVLADSAQLGPKREAEAEGEGGQTVPAAGTRDNVLYRLGSWLFRGYQRLVEPAAPLPEPEVEDPSSPQKTLDSPEIRAALDGRYGARTRTVPGERAMTLYSALPIWDGDQVVGVVQVSQSTFRLLQSLHDIRLGVFRIFLASLAAAVVLTLVVSTTIVRPLRRLRDEANALLDRRGRILRRFRGARRRDEIGDLSRALEELTHRLEEHVRFIESFAADLAHEFKNPLASIRAATEMLAEVSDPAERRHFLGVAEREVARMEHLLAESRELARVDAGLEKEERRPVDLNELLRSIVEGYRLRGNHEVRIDLLPWTTPLVVEGSAERLTEVFENILDNALSFSPRGSAVRIELARRDGGALATISDEGPGIPPESQDLIFSRFYSYRPGRTAREDGHSGLGLALVKAIVEGYGGTVRASNRPEGGACFSLRLPLG